MLLDKIRPFGRIFVERRDGVKGADVDLGIRVGLKRGW